MDPVTEFLRSYLVPAGTGLAGDPGLKASHWSTGGALSVFETSIAGGPPLHVHDREDECFYVLDGELSVRCGEEAFSAGTGSFVFLPRGRPHRFWAPAQPARLLLIVAPAGIEDYFREINGASTDDERHQIGERFSMLRAWARRAVRVSGYGAARPCAPPGAGRRRLPVGRAAGLARW
jgi:mannose-6-phosphate isomerase-like protein (cupin superfamily)